MMDNMTDFEISVIVFNTIDNIHLHEINLKNPFSRLRSVFHGHINLIL